MRHSDRCDVLVCLLTFLKWSCGPHLTTHPTKIVPSSILQKRPSAFRKEKSLAYNKGKAFWRNTGSEFSRRNKAGDLIDAGNHWKVDINLHDLFEGCNQSAWRHERRWTGARCTFGGHLLVGVAWVITQWFYWYNYIYIYTCIEETTIQVCTIHTKYVSLFHPFHRLDAYTVHITYLISSYCIRRAVHALINFLVLKYFKVFLVATFLSMFPANSNSDHWEGDNVCLLGKRQLQSGIYMYVYSNIL